MHPNHGRVVSNFIVPALRGEDITLDCDGLQTPSFCYLDGLIEAAIRFTDLPRGEAGLPAACLARLRL